MSDSIDVSRHPGDSIRVQVMPKRRRSWRFWDRGTT